jgi:hypothetical protein
MNDFETLIPTREDRAQLGFWDQHRFLLLIIGTIVISLVLVVVSVVIYNVSGSAQLDLSRPGYQSVSNQVERGSDIEDFSATGPVTLEVIDGFTELYDAQAKRAKAVDAFNGDPLNPELLEFSDSSASE